MELNAKRRAPKVLISHASEDKQRFVLPLAAELRANGVDSWVDVWEINPGDSLIGKIFDEGLKNSRNSSGGPCDFAGQIPPNRLTYGG